MVKAFGVTKEYVENEIASSVGRLHYKIDCMAGTILTNDYLNYEKTDTKVFENASTEHIKQELCTRILLRRETTYLTGSKNLPKSSTSSDI
jgi:hypothetical protein